jgi:ubiquinol-cytochrome c reductase cytochrome b subunit
VPEWYFLPFYAILRAIPSKLGGVCAMFGALVVLFFIPWLDTSRVRSTRYRPIYKYFFWMLVFSCIALGFLGSKSPEGTYLWAARFFTLYYFAHFLLILPIVGLIETPKPMPNSVADSFSHRVPKGERARAVPAE